MHCFSSRTHTRFPSSFPSLSLDQHWTVFACLFVGFLHNEIVDKYYYFQFLHATEKTVVAVAQLVLSHTSGVHNFSIRAYICSCGQVWWTWTRAHTQTDLHTRNSCQICLDCLLFWLFGLTTNSFSFYIRFFFVITWCFFCVVCGIYSKFVTIARDWEGEVEKGR